MRRTGLFRLLHWSDHLSDQYLERLSDGTLNWAENLVAHLHLKHCSSCRTRHEDIMRRPGHVFSLFEKKEQLRHVPYPHRRGETLRRLYVHMDTYVPPQRWSSLSIASTLNQFPRMEPTLVVTLVFSLCAMCSLAVWMHQRRTPSISASDLLARAADWDKPSARVTEGVVYQQVRIRAPQTTMERAIYRDVSAHRRMRIIKLNANEERLRNRLFTAGVNWDAPLEASGYREWHNHLGARKDSINRNDEKTLTLTTTIPTGDVAEQTLTVRKSDFHPILRTVAFRDKERVEIAELDYRVLPWSAVDVNIFEPIGSTDLTKNVIPFPSLPTPLSEGQLDETELGVRMVLNRMHADVGQTIELRRLPDGIEVVGYVDSDQWKRELTRQLDMLPHVTASLRSVSDGGVGQESPKVAPPTIRTTEMSDQESPLGIYLRAHGYSLTSVIGLSQKLFDSAFRVSQESEALNNLNTRFSNDEQRTVIAAATLAELRYSHHERLEAALDEERTLLSEIGALNQVNISFHPSEQPVSKMAAKNLELCKELTATNHPAARKTEAILSDVLGLLEQFRKEGSRSHMKGTIAGDGRN